MAPCIGRRLTTLLTVQTVQIVRMKTKDKIIAKAIMLFNKQGVANVRLQDIAKECHISPGNLNYHFKLKKDLILAVLDYMTASFQLMKGDYVYKLDQNNYSDIVKSFLNFQIRHRFFYRDILQISSFSDEAVTLFEYQMNGVINFTYNGMNLGCRNTCYLGVPLPLSDRSGSTAIQKYEKSIV